MISVTKQIEAAEANVCREGLQNDSEELRVIHRAMAVDFCMARDAGAAFITKNWVAAQLKRSAHFIQRNWHRSPHDLQTEFRGSLPGHWFSPKKVVILWVRVLTVRETAFGCCCCCCWQPHGLLICNSWFFKIQQTHQSETLHSNVTLFRLLYYSKSFANVLLVSAVEGGAIIIEHPVQTNC